MDFVEAVESVLKNHAKFSGRAARSEYWWWIVFLSLTNGGVGILDGLLISPLFGFQRFEIAPLSLILCLVFLLPSLAVSVRRLHDLNLSGWWILFLLIPVVGPIAAILCFIWRGTDGPNMFGEDPLAKTVETQNAV